MVDIFKPTIRRLRLGPEWWRQRLDGRLHWPQLLQEWLIAQANAYFRIYNTHIHTLMLEWVGRLGDEATCVRRLNAEIGGRRPGVYEMETAAAARRLQEARRLNHTGGASFQPGAVRRLTATGDRAGTRERESGRDAETCSRPCTLKR